MLKQELPQGVGTDKLIDSSGDFITNGVVAGMTVRNVSTGEYCGNLLGNSN